ncbi:divergent polysaccharide deacetylase family protein [Holophaga foetida]|uniref:divergent polysaccharide deacetylase family protein n=1 Tax=Holophaga foetida TaxID=35839 RepID=UPI000247175B|nr:divergent polysaccharide deacetylase family protein [Holophaga foetida]
MAPKRRGGGTSTGKLLVLACTMLLVGLGLGLLFSSYGCDRKRDRSGEGLLRPEPQRPVRPPKRPEKPTEPVPESPEPEPTKPAEPKGHKEPVPEPETPSKLPSFALIIDDLGYARPELVTRLCAQSVPFAVAVLPFQEFSRQSAEIAHTKGKEVMLHLPMEPIGYPGPSKNPGPGAVFYNQSESEVRATVRKALAEVPHHRGVNNHMGSRITPDRTRMGWVLQEIHRSGCFFVDSRTEKDTVALAVAQSLRVPAIQRKVFLDDDKRFGEMEKQWDRAIAIAKKEGHVVIIGHIYPETVEALEKLVPKSKDQVRFVKVGELVR